MKRQLLLGSGNSPRKRLWGENESPQWEQLVRLDIDPGTNPDLVWDLDDPQPLPFAAAAFDEIHAYHVLEHIGHQGDWRFFFAHFNEMYRLLSASGRFYGIVPWWQSEVAWIDPGHRRIIPPGMLIFLSRDAYAEQVGITAMSDYRAVLRADFEPIFIRHEGDELFFILQKRGGQ